MRPNRQTPMPSERQREVAAKVLAAWQAGHRWYRARGSGERVTLVSLQRAGVLVRRVWRGGPRSAAHEYRPSNAFLLEVARASGVSESAQLLPVENQIAHEIAQHAKENDDGV